MFIFHLSVMAQSSKILKAISSDYVVPDEGKTFFLEITLLVYISESISKLSSKAHMTF